LRNVLISDVGCSIFRVLLFFKGTQEGYAVSDFESGELCERRGANAIRPYMVRGYISKFISVITPPLWGSGASQLFLFILFGDRNLFRAT
jgi:hypothetical protein